jgi:hypothetical protein
MHLAAALPPRPPPDASPYCSASYIRTPAIAFPLLPRTKRPYHVEQRSALLSEKPSAARRKSCPPISQSARPSSHPAFLLSNARVALPRSCRRRCPAVRPRLPPFACPRQHVHQGRTQIWLRPRDSREGPMRNLEICAMRSLQHKDSQARREV